MFEVKQVTGSEWREEQLSVRVGVRGQLDLRIYLSGVKIKRGRWWMKS